MTKNFDFDMIMGSISQSISPGSEQREFWGSQKADLKGGRNYMGVRSPVLDDLIEKIIMTTKREELLPLVHALDRTLLWGFYAIPAYSSGTLRIAHTHRLKHPETFPVYGFDINCWWIEDSSSKSEK